MGPMANHEAHRALVRRGLILGTPAPAIARGACSSIIPFADRSAVTSSIVNAVGALRVALARRLAFSRLRWTPVFPDLDQLIACWSRWWRRRWDVNSSRGTSDPWIRLRQHVPINEFLNLCRPRHQGLKGDFNVSYHHDFSSLPQILRKTAPHGFLGSTPDWSPFPLASFRAW